MSPPALLESARALRDDSANGVQRPRLSSAFTALPKIDHRGTFKRQCHRFPPITRRETATPSTSSGDEDSK